MCEHIISDYVRGRSWNVHNEVTKSENIMRVFTRTPVNLNEFQIPKGRVYLILERCKGCNLCIELCPQQVLQVSEKINDKGYHYPEIRINHEDACVHCEFCTMVCPEFAIYTLEVEE